MTSWPQQNEQISESLNLTSGTERCKGKNRNNIWLILVYYVFQMTKLKQVRGAVRNELFPTADMVVSMSKEFGVPFTTEDFEGKDLS